MATPRKGGHCRNHGLNRNWLDLKPIALRGYCKSHRRVRGVA